MRIGLGSPDPIQQGGPRWSVLCQNGKNFDKTNGQRIRLAE